MATLKTARRFYLRQRVVAMALGDPDIAGVWRWKQEHQPGTALPADFPLLTRLATAGYTTIQDLDGADEAELRAACFTQAEAKRILAALHALPAFAGADDFSDPNQSAHLINV